MDARLLNLFWNFFGYSLAGWCLEVAFTAFKKRKLINKGFLNGPLCPIYGISAVLISLFFSDLRTQPVFLFIGCMVLCTFIELTAGNLLFFLFRQKWWDYSARRFHGPDGFICLEFSLFWGSFGTMMVLLINPLFNRLTSRVPRPLSLILLLGISFIFLCDLSGTLFVLLKLRRPGEQIVTINRGLRSLSRRLRIFIRTRIEKRVNKAYPQVDTRREVEKAAKKPVFAEGNSFYKLVLLFAFMALSGAVIETIFMFFKYGYYTNRSSLLYGQFSLVWGFAVVLMNLFLYRYKDSAVKLFVLGTVLGGTYEYICSAVTERLFGTIFWDYSHMPLNLGGRINLLYCLLWGVVAVVWLKFLYPPLSRLIERLPQRFGVLLCRGFLIFMTVDILLSSAALTRYHERRRLIPPPNKVAEWIDNTYMDGYMANRFPFARIVR